MNTPSFKFKKMICSHNISDGKLLISRIYNWLGMQLDTDFRAHDLYKCIEQIHLLIIKSERKNEYNGDALWHTLTNYDSCPLFQAIVNEKGPPTQTIPTEIKGIKLEPRKAIPKKIRGEAWKIQFGDSIKGSCFCCKKELDVFDDWHAGHIVSHSNNGTDTADNLRPVCGSCNLSMGTENMDAFKARCYPN